MEIKEIQVMIAQVNTVMRNADSEIQRVFSKCGKGMQWQKPEQNPWLKIYEKQNLEARRFKTELELLLIESKSCSKVERFSLREQVKLGGTKMILDGCYVAFGTVKGEDDSTLKVFIEPISNINTEKFL